MRHLFVLSFCGAVIVGCRPEVPAEMRLDAASTRTEAPPVAAAPVHKRPKAPGNVEHGWDLFREHCSSCHGIGRRGTGERASALPKRPADLRDPILLASRTDARIAEVILGGIKVVPDKGKKPSPFKKDMPAFSKELGEQDVMDIIAFLRGDSIYLEECFDDATHYLVAAPPGEGAPALIAAYSSADKQPRPLVVKTSSELPAAAKRIGYLTFVELDIPGAGPTPVAFLAGAEGDVTGARVALPEPDNENARRDFEAALARGVEGAPRLRPIIPAIEATKQWLKEAIAKAPR